MRRRWWPCVPAAVSLAGCSGSEVQSVLEPIGPDAALLANLSWLLFAGGGLMFLLTMAFMAVAVWGGEAQRRVLRSRRSILAGGVVFPVVVLTALLVETLRAAEALDARAPGGGEPPRIEVVGQQFWWEVRYPSATPDGGGAVTANEIHIPAGREVELRASAGDVYHSLWIPSLQGKIDMVPGRVNTLRVRAGGPGVDHSDRIESRRRVRALRPLNRVLEPNRPPRQRTGLDLPFPATRALLHGRPTGLGGDRSRRREGRPARRGRYAGGPAR